LVTLYLRVPRSTRLCLCTRTRTSRLGNDALNTPAWSSRDQHLSDKVSPAQLLPSTDKATQLEHPGSRRKLSALLPVSHRLIALLGGNEISGGAGWERTYDSFVCFLEVLGAGRGLGFGVCGVGRVGSLLPDGWVREVRVGGIRLRVVGVVCTRAGLVLFWKLV
jgi:hypothetical protein